MKVRFEKGWMSAVNDTTAYSVSMNTELLAATMHSGLYASFSDLGNVSFFLCQLKNTYAKSRLWSFTINP